MRESNKRRGIVITLVVAIIFIVTGTIFLIGNDKKKEALLGAKNYFTLSEDRYFEEYFAYKTFYKESVKKDTVLQGKLMEKVAGVTIEADFESNIDKTNKMIDNQWTIGLGGMPFATIQTISDQNNLYFVSDMFQDKVPYIEYTGDLSAWDGKLGIDKTGIKMIQNSYIAAYNHMVSTNSYGGLEKLWENKELCYDFMQMYKNLTVEKSKNTYGGHHYTVTILPQDVERFLSDLKSQFPEYEVKGYTELISMFVSKDKGLVIEEDTDKNGKVVSLMVENKENGYCALTQKTAQEKDGKTGFQENVSLSILNNKKSFVDVQFNLDYSTKDNKVYFTVKEKNTGIMMDCAAVLSLKAGEKKFSLVFDDIKLKFGDVKFDMTGNVQMAFGDYPVSVPKGDKIDLINGTDKEKKELISQIKKSLGGIVSGALSTVLGF